MSQLTIRELMSDQVFTIQEEESAQQAARKMHQHNVGFLPVVAGQNTVGVVTDRDLVLRILAENKPYDWPVKNVMSSNVETIDINSTADEAAAKMGGTEIRRLLVMENGKLAGVITLGDLAIHSEMKQESATALQSISMHA